MFCCFLRRDPTALQPGQQVRLGLQKKKKKLLRADQVHQTAPHTCSMFWIGELGGWRCRTFKKVFKISCCEYFMCIKKKNWLTASVLPFLPAYQDKTCPSPCPWGISELCDINIINSTAATKLIRSFTSQMSIYFGSGTGNTETNKIKLRNMILNFTRLMNSPSYYKGVYYCSLHNCIMRTHEGNFLSSPQIQKSYAFLRQLVSFYLLNPVNNHKQRNCAFPFYWLP